MHKTLSGLTAAAALVGLAGTGLGYQLARDAVSGCGGSASGGGYAAGWSVGLPVVGTSTGGGQEETVGFWRRVGGAVSDVPGFPAETMPAFTALIPSRPNPFGSHAVLRFQIASDVGATTPVRVEVFDVTGRSLRVLVNEALPGGEFEVTWDRTDGSGVRAANGIYFARMQTPSYTKSIRLVATS